jgi:dihydrolipoamide dehydrogenase
MDFQYDVIVIGAGPGGYVSAIRASQLGLKTCVIEKEALGGVCLNWGCIPTKALLKSAHLFLEMKEAKEFGLATGTLKADFSAVVQRSRKVAGQMSKGVDFLMKKNKIQIEYGTAKFHDKHTLELTSSEGNKTITGKYTIIATGGRSRPMPGLPFDGKIVLSSREAMVLDDVPKKLAIIGAGAIGVEFADVYNAMGSEVTIIEALEHLLPNEDEEISKVLEKSYNKRGIKQKLGYFFQSAKMEKNSITLQIQPKSGDGESITVDKVIVGIGVIPNTENMNLEEIGIKLKKGFVDVDSHYRSTVDNIYAIGDCIPTPLLAHVASREGVLASEDISIRSGNPHHILPQTVDYRFIPGCTYCTPEVASVGMTEKKALGNGHKIKIGRFPFTASGRAQAQGNTTGLVKVISNEETGEILGAHIIGEGATELISEYTLGASLELGVKDIANTIHAHPTLSEGLMEASADALGEAINI